MMTPKNPLHIVTPSKAATHTSLPVAPEPEAADAAAGLAQAQALARRFLPQCVSLLAATAFDPASRVKPHTRMVAAVQLKSVALVGLEPMGSTPDGGNHGSEGEADDDAA
jgi:hypothetical protein